MGLVVVLIAASAAFGFAASVWIKRYALELVSLVVVFSVAIVLQLNGFGFKDGAIPLVVALLSSQVGYLCGLLVRSRGKIWSLLSGEVLDNGPDSRGERDIRDDQEKRD
jgi:hypothetical protein